MITGQVRTALSCQLRSRSGVGAHEPLDLDEIMPKHHGRAWHGQRLGPTQCLSVNMPTMCIIYAATVGLISPDQDLCIAQGHNVHCNPEPSHLCGSASQQGLPNQV